MSARALEIIFDETGAGFCLHSEVIPLEEIGTLEVSRASNVEFNHESQRWEVIGLDGAKLFDDVKRSACLTWESENLDTLRVHARQTP